MTIRVWATWIVLVAALFFGRLIYIAYAISTEDDISTEVKVPHLFDAVVLGLLLGSLFLTVLGVIWQR